jgi:pimeloyl-ACP methyl ester carboxylesterase
MMQERNSLPKYLAAVALAATVGATYGAYANLAQARGYRGYEPFATMGATGNHIVSYRRGLDTTFPVVVFIPGLLSSVSTLAQMADEIYKNFEVECVLYNRAGYGASRINTARPFSLSEAIDDLVTMLTTFIDNGRSIHLVGHSLGGLLAYFTALRMGEDVSSVLLLDPTHPYELRHSKAQYLGAEGLDFTLMLSPATMRMGGSLLLSRKQILTYAENNRYRDRIWLDAASSKVHAAGRREWRYLHPVMIDWPSPIPSLNVPLTLIAAGETLENIPKHLELYAEYVEAGNPGRLEELTEAGHQSLVTEPRFINEICKVLEVELPRRQGGDGVTI